MEADTPSLPVALTLAGSDSGGGAGVQMDLRVFARQRVFGTAVVTAITAQNLDGVRDVVGLSPAIVGAQMRAVFDGFAVGAAKTGMLWSEEIVTAVAQGLPQAVPLVVDPVMVATSGARLLDRGAEGAYRAHLLPRATLMTPNLDEAAVLLDVERIDGDAMPAAARQLFERLGCAVLLKGGHRRGEPLDVLHFDGGQAAWRHPRLAGVNTHGSGCMLAAALAAELARDPDLDLPTACERALCFVHTALEHPLRLSGGIALAGVEGAVTRSGAVERIR